MRLLAIEASFSSCSVALAADGQLRQRESTEPRGHADRLLPWVDELLAEAGLSLSRLDAIAFSRGPGSFTSLRIGVGVAQGLAWGADLPVVPVSSLAALADALDPRPGGAVLVAMDARMGEVYSASFRVGEQGAEAIGAEQLLDPAAVRAPDGDWTAAGNGFERFDALRALSASADSVRADARPDARAVARLAEAWLAKHEPLAAEQAQPVYLREKVAELPKD